MENVFCRPRKAVKVGHVSVDLGSELGAVAGEQVYRNRQFSSLAMRPSSRMASNRDWANLSWTLFEKKWRVIPNCHTQPDPHPFEAPELFLVN